jgi:hypothetical protein
MVHFDHRGIELNRPDLDGDSGESRAQYDLDAAATVV